MQRKITYKILISIIIALAIIITSSYTFATITPDMINGTSDGTSDLDLSFMDTVTDAVSTIGIFIAVGTLMVIGIKYLVGSLEEKANYKKTMMPWVIGCFILFGASALAPEIQELFSDIGDDTTTIGNGILGIIQVLGTLVSVGAIMVLGIKYMVGSVEERAEYKRTMIPWVIGCALLFGAVNITATVYDSVTNAVPVSEETETTSTSTSTTYTKDEDGTLYCDNCGDKLTTKEQHNGQCSNCGKYIQGI